MMNIKDLRLQYGMNRLQFAEFFGIPYRTIQDWELENRKCPAYLFDLMKYKLAAEAATAARRKQKIYLIYKDSMDDACEIYGYIKGSEEEADKYCDSHNETCRYEWEEIHWQVIEDLSK